MERLTGRPSKKAAVVAERSMEIIIFQTSLIAAFVAGMVALFAPCCITFLLPAYLGSVFKEKEKVILMTLVFGSGIFIVLLPAVLGVAFISRFIFNYHEVIYLIGGIVMLVVAVTTFLGVKLPMPQIKGFQFGGRSDVVSIFTLGIFSGITSACCAPVLIGILTLTFLSPNFAGALLLGAVYVLGMITPLLLISLFLTKRMPKFTLLRKPLVMITLFGKQFPVILSNMIAGAIFFITGVLIIALTQTGKLSTADMEDATKFIANVGEVINRLVGGNILANVIFLAAVIFLLYKVFKKV